MTLDGAPVDRLNELECVDGQVWANVWQTDRIVRIDPATGRVTAVVDAAGLLDPGRRAGTDVLNGIAAVPGDDGTFLVTGKLWPVTFRVRFVGLRAAPARAGGGRGAAVAGLGQNGRVAFGHRRRWVGTDGAPVIRRWTPAGGRGDRRARAGPPRRPGAAATDVVDDDALPRPACRRPRRSPRGRAGTATPTTTPRSTGRRRAGAGRSRPRPSRPRARAGPGPAPQRVPRKLTVTRVAALRSREITENGIRAFHRAATADGADRSGLTALTYATMMTYAVDAAVAVALANTLFFAAATAESKTNVALYLAITVAPFAVVAPVIGPLLDRLQRGRRAALAVSFGGRAVLAVVMAFGYDSWVLYPAALGAMVLSKSFVVLKAAVTPRVLPETITLVTTNSRLTTFGLASGAVFGGVAAGIAAVWGSPGALFFTAALGVAGVVLCLRIPAWVEVTEGEVPATLHESTASRDPRPPRAHRRWGARRSWRCGATARPAC